MQQKIYIALLSIWVLCMAAPTLQAELSAQSDEASTADTSPNDGKISLAEVAPEFYYAFRRYPKF
jgi:hypothetical protein